MASVFETRALEQSILRLLLTSKMEARLNMHRLASMHFSSPVREFIYNTAVQALDDSGSLLTEKLFEFELKQHVPSSDQDSFRAEWKVIQKMKVDESSDAIIFALEKAALAQSTNKICQGTAELLQDGKVEEAVAFLQSEAVRLGASGDEKPTVDITDVDARLQVLLDKISHPEKYLGIQTGFKDFDEKTGGLFPSELTLVSAVTGVGKSTLMKAMAYNIVSNPVRAVNVLHVTNEESSEQVQMKYDALFTNIDYLRIKRAQKISPEEIETWKKKMEFAKDSRFGRIYVKEIPQFSNAIQIERAFYELDQKGIPIHVIIIDYLDHMMPVQKAWGENDEQGKAAADCKGLAIQLHLPVVTATQTATVAEAKQEKGKSFAKLDVYGSKRKVHAANTLLYVVQGDQDVAQIEEGREKWECDWFWTIAIAKNRDGPPFEFPMRQKVRTGHVVPLNKKEEKHAKKSKPDKEGDAVSDAKDEAHDDVLTDEVQKTLEAARIMTKKGVKKGEKKESSEMPAPKGVKNGTPKISQPEDEKNVPKGKKKLPEQG